MQVVQDHSDLLGTAADIERNPEVRVFFFRTLREWENFLRIEARKVKYIGVFPFGLLPIGLLPFWGTKKDNPTIVAEANELCMDGTFQITPRLFYQVFTVHAFKDGQQFPLAYCLLPGKIREVYNECFTMLMSEISMFFQGRSQLTLNLACYKQSSCCSQQQRCFYHYSQSIWRKVQKLGLQTMY